MISQDAKATAMSPRFAQAIESDHTDAPICKGNCDDLARPEKQLRDSARQKAIAIAKVAKELQWYRDACG